MALAQTSPKFDDHDNLHKVAPKNRQLERNAVQRFIFHVLDLNRHEHQTK